jgi:hypothetical protein
LAELDLDGITAKAYASETLGIRALGIIELRSTVA